MRNSVSNSPQETRRNDFFKMVEESFIWNKGTNEDKKKENNNK